jgi:hypothetical protein
MLIHHSLVLCVYLKLNYTYAIPSECLFDIDCADFVQEG